MVAIVWVDTTFRTGLVCFHYYYHSYYNDSVRQELQEWDGEIKKVMVATHFVNGRFAC